MPQYRKKPVVIEARRVPGWDDRANAITFVDEAIALAEWCGGRSHLMEPPAGVAEGIYIPTLEGEMRADPGDYVIRGVQGEFYPCKPDIFEATYEEVED